jgi:hypothetical protein
LSPVQRNIIGNADFASKIESGLQVPSASIQSSVNVPFSKPAAPITLTNSPLVPQALIDHNLPSAYKSVSRSSTSLLPPTLESSSNTPETYQVAGGVMPRNVPSSGSLSTALITSELPEYSFPYTVDDGIRLSSTSAPTPTFNADNILASPTLSDANVVNEHAARQSSVRNKSVLTSASSQFGILHSQNSNKPLSDLESRGHFSSNGMHVDTQPVFMTAPRRVLSNEVQTNAHQSKIPPTGVQSIPQSGDARTKLPTAAANHVNEFKSRLAKSTTSTAPVMATHAPSKGSTNDAQAKLAVPSSGAKLQPRPKSTAATLTEQPRLRPGTASVVGKSSVAQAQQRPSLGSEGNQTTSRAVGESLPDPRDFLQLLKQVHSRA